MKNLLKISASIILLLFISCKEESDKPKVTYEKPTQAILVSKVSPLQIRVADLPFQMPGTNYLIHPIADLSISGGSLKTRSESSTNANEVNFKISNYSEYEITGYLRNMQFQEIGTDSLRPLSLKPVLIQTATYLKSVSDRVKQQVMVYTLADMDTNKDGKLDENDVKSLYLSEISGERFTKITADFQELIDWKLIESKNRLYFRTIEDNNKNGYFDKSDVIHYHYIDLSTKTWNISDYNPVK
jgi:hypothetical protein